MSDKLTAIVTELTPTHEYESVQGTLNRAARLILAAREERDNEQRCRKEDADYLHGLISEWKFDHEKAVEERDDLQAQWAEVANSLLNTKSQLRETQEKLEQLFRKASEDMAALRSERDQFEKDWIEARDYGRAQNALFNFDNWHKMEDDRASWHKIADERAAELVRVTKQRDNSAELHAHVLHEVCTERDTYIDSLKAQAAMINEYLKRIGDLEDRIEELEKQGEENARLRAAFERLETTQDPDQSGGWETGQRETLAALRAALAGKEGEGK